MWEMNCHTFKLMDAQRFLEEAGAFFIPTPAKYKTEFSFLKEVDSLALANAQLDLKNANKRHRVYPQRQILCFAAV